DPKDNALHLLCLFLAEEMRMRSLSLGAGKEIARAVLSNKNLIDNEEHMLRLTLELAKDFPQLKRFEQKLAIYIERQSRSDAEKNVEFNEEQMRETVAMLESEILAENRLNKLAQ